MPGTNASCMSMLSWSLAQASFANCKVVLASWSSAQPPSGRKDTVCFQLGEPLLYVLNGVLVDLVLLLQVEQVC